MSVMLVVGIGMRFGTPIVVTISDVSVRLDRMNLPVAIILGMILNAVLPNQTDADTKKADADTKKVDEA